MGLIRNTDQLHIKTRVTLVKVQDLNDQIRDKDLGKLMLECNCSNSATLEPRELVNSVPFLAFNISDYVIRSRNALHEIDIDKFLAI